MRIFYLSFLILIPTFVFGAEGDFYAIAPIPGLNTQTNLGQYINAIFDFAIVIGAILAVFQLIRAGFQYITTEAVTDKKNSRETIANALIGLILLLSVTLILNTINPQITNLDLLNFDKLKSGTSVDIEGYSPPASRNTIVSTRTDYGGALNMIKLNPERAVVYYGMKQDKCPQSLKGFGEETDPLVKEAPIDNCKADLGVNSCCVYSKY